MATLSSVLNSPRAITVNIEIMRAFVRLQGNTLGANKEVARKLELHDGKLTTHDEANAAVLSTIRELMAPPEPEKTPKKRRIGFVTDD